MKVGLEVTSGLKRGQEVVTSAQFLLDSESRFREAIANMLKPAGEASLGAPAPAWTGAPAPKAPAPGMEPMHQKH